ncbi:alpha-amylase family glycosyl hydrolase [Jannaschia sp. W003]|uniref:alpha-amylase family glycosyl hydrolase n=1 Tax=Jannaschia sp. W003 TaxID=2867012 RepID=UPI0021A86D23|nr:alpha-amylase family glycosyl hydrolase [Jannaschia sp. W003]UWQ21304.1 alpha-amylase [Jannaschia sp. W003]
MPPITHRVWPKAPVIYQIYPRSFRDSTGSGTGDLKGICLHLEHVANLGADAIWISPFYPSPFTDGGYDIADHIDVHPALGTLDDFDRLVEVAHGLGLKVLIDQVFNHTSTVAPWFQRSLMRDPDYEDFYVWRDPKPDGTAPNNWLSQFGPPAWTWNHRRRQYYHHNFTKHQPSLNLRCERVQEQMRRIMRFWLDRGVDGFRLDAVTSFLFDPEERDNPPATPEVQRAVSGETFVPYTYQDHVYDILPGDGLPFMERLRNWAGEDVFLLGEVTSGNKSVELACGLSAPGRLSAAYTTDFPENDASAEAYAAILKRACDPQRLGWWLSSHDQPRHAAKAGDGSERDVRFLALVLATAPGPVLLYQGEELGLRQPDLPFEAVTDPLDLLYWPDGPGREGPRVPMPWAEGTGRGFTIGTPWLPMDWPQGQSVAVQEISERSNLGFYRRAFAFRREHDMGNMALRDWSRDGEVMRLSYETPGSVGTKTAEVVLNFGEGSARCRKAPDLASTPFDGTHMPGRTGAVWLGEAE